MTSNIVEKSTMREYIRIRALTLTFVFSGYNCQLCNLYILIKVEFGAISELYSMSKSFRYFWDTLCIEI